MSSLLVAEDNEDLRLFLAEALRLDGHEVRTAADGVEVARLLDDAATMPDLVLLDLVLPRVSGRDVLRAMRSVQRSRHIPVVVLTGQLVDSRELSPFGVSTVLLKPVAIDILIATVARLCAPPAAVGHGT